MLQTWTTLHVSAHITTTLLLKVFCTLPRNFSWKQTYFVNKVTKIQQKSYKHVPISFYVKIVVVDCHFTKTDPVIPQNDIRHSVWHLSPSGLAWIDANFLLTEARCLGESHPACADIFYLLPATHSSQHFAEACDLSSLISQNFASLSKSSCWDVALTWCDDKFFPDISNRVSFQPWKSSAKCLNSAS